LISCMDKIISILQILTHLHASKSSVIVFCETCTGNSFPVFEIPGAGKRLDYRLHDGWSFLSLSPGSSLQSRSHLNRLKHCQARRSDASLHVDHLGDIHGSRSGARPPIREAITKKVYISPGSGSLAGDKKTLSVVYY
jgi:hypothetical protein